MNKIKTVFMGTPDFASPSLNSLIEDDRFDVVAVFTQPDKAVGRSSKLQETPIKKIAKKSKIPVFQPEKISPNDLVDIEIDLIVVVAYAQMIPQSILDIPKYGFINVHGSLLPKYRGSSCIQAPILNGDKKSGVTIMKIDAGMDTGDILSQKEIVLDKKETTGTLFKKISVLGSEILADTAFKYIKGEIKPKKQDDSKASIVKKTKKEDGKINWDNDSVYIERQIRAMNPWPGAWSHLDSKLFKIHEADTCKQEDNEINPGVIYSKDTSLYIKCGSGSIKIIKLQLEGKKPIKALDFINGNKNLLNKTLK